MGFSWRRDHRKAGAAPNSLTNSACRRSRESSRGMDLVVSTPGTLQKFLVSEIARWGKVVRENKIRPE